MCLYGRDPEKDKGTNKLLKASMANILLCIILLFIVFAMLYRVQRGVELTDESWYVAEPYAVAKGAVAFADNLSQAPGFTIPLALFYKIYLLINGSAEGIYLFSRYLYVAFLSMISMVTFYVVNKYTKLKVPVIGMGVMMTMGIYSLFDINYNTIGQAYLPLICSLIFAEYDEDDGSKSLRWGILAGLIFGRTVIGTPQVLVPCLVLGIYLIVQKKWKRITGIAIGTVITAIIVVGYACIAGGLKHFINGIYMFFNDLFYFKIEMRYTFIENCILFLWFLMPAIVALVFLGIMKILLREKKNWFRILVRVTILFFVLLGMILAIRNINPGENYVEHPFLKWSWFGILLYDIFSVERTDKYCMSVAAVVSLAFFSGFVFSGFTNIYGFAGDRTYWLYVPLLIVLCLIFNEREKTKYSSGISMTAIVFIGVMVVLRMFNNYNYVYRDEKLMSLSTKVEEGVWKGIYTTSERANDVIDLERYLKSITTEEDRVLLLDQVCFAYTMINGQIWSSTTSDPNSYTYEGLTNMIYDYCVNMKGVPTKIIYIDFGWGEQLSIDDDTWGFNDFVLSNYIQADDYANDSFTVKEFILENEANAMFMAYEKGSALPFK